MSKFHPLSAFQQPLIDGYQLLPFRFTSLDDHEYVLTNQAGEFIVLERPTLEALVRHQLPATDWVYDDLKSKHFIIDRDSSVAMDLLPLKVRTKLQRVAEFTGLHIFVVSLRCEHSRPYCQVSRQSNDKLAFDMSVETAEKALALVFRSPSLGIKIEFQGGEPLLNFPLIQHVVERAEAWNLAERRDLQFVIATNLALISEEILDFCRDHDILISTSLDGPSDLHNANRPRPGNNSYERAIEGISRVRNSLGRDRVSALMTTTKLSLGRVRDIVDEYVEQGFRGIFLRPMSPYGFAVKTKWFKAYDADEWLEFYFTGLDYILDLNRSGCALTEFYAATILAKMLVDLQSPAGIGIAAIVYNYDGDVYASDESRMLAEMGDKTFRLGNVHRDRYEDIILSDALLGPIDWKNEYMPECEGCREKENCGGFFASAKIRYSDHIQPFS